MLTDVAFSFWEGPDPWSYSQSLAALRTPAVGVSCGGESRDRVRNTGRLNGSWRVARPPACDSRSTDSRRCFERDPRQAFNPRGRRAVCGPASSLRPEPGAP